MTSLFHSPDNPFLDKVRADKCFTLTVIKALSTLCRRGGIDFTKQGCENSSVLVKEIKKLGVGAVNSTLPCQTDTGTESRDQRHFQNHLCKQDIFAQVGKIFFSIF